MRKKIMILFAGVTIVLTVGVFGALMFYKPKEPEKPKGVVFTEEKEEPVTGVNYPKEQLRQKMLDAYDYYDTVQGKIRTNSSVTYDSGAARAVYFGIDQTNGYGYVQATSGDRDWGQEDRLDSLRVVDGKLVTDYDYARKTKEQYDSEADRMIYDIGVDNIDPQWMTDIYLHKESDWRITKEEEVAGRLCYKIEGGVPLESSSIESFHMWVDQETGCIIQLRAFNSEGDIQAYLLTDEIRFNEPVERVDPGWEGE